MLSVISNLKKYLRTTLQKNKKITTSMRSARVQWWDGMAGHHLNLILYSTLFIEDSLSETDWSMNDQWKPGRKEKCFRQNISKVSPTPTPVLTRIPDTWHMTHETMTRDTWLRQFSLSDRVSRLMTCCWRGGQTSLIRFHHLPTSSFPGRESPTS